METQTKSYKKTENILPVETFGRNPIVGEYSTEPSMTEPGQVMSIDQIMERHVLGLPVPSAVGTYDYDENDDSWENDDFSPEDQHDIDFSDVIEQHRVVTSRIIDYNSSQSDGARQTEADATATDSRASETEHSDE